MKHIQAKLEQLKESSAQDFQRIAENFELDFPLLSSSHAWYPEHGNNVHPEIGRKFFAGLEGFSKERYDFDVFLKEVENFSFRLLHDHTEKAPFLLPKNRERNLCPRTDQNTYSQSFTRYFSAKRFYDLFVDPDRLEGDQPVSEKKFMVNEYIESLPDVEEEERPPRWLGVSPQVLAQNSHYKPKPIWIVPTQEAPHRQSDFDQWDEQTKVAHVVKQMALPGFHSYEKRKENIGIIAVEFTLDTDTELFKPTALDALDSPNFFPAPHQEYFGLTYVLDSDFDTPIQEKGLKEYLCKAFTVPVKFGEEIHVIKIGDFVS